MVREEIITIISMLQTDNIFYTPSTLREVSEKMRKNMLVIQILDMFSRYEIGLPDKKYAC